MAQKSGATRSKQEILEQRKEMMKSKVKSKVDNFQSSMALGGGGDAGDKSADGVGALPLDLM